MRLFADTFYFIALLNRKDRAHAAASKVSRSTSKLVTTEWVLIELADAMSSIQKRGSYCSLYRLLRSDPAITIIRVTSEFLDRGFDLFEDRPDKEWSLTDCTSFVIMQDLAISDALTGDHHFEQAGFQALLKRP
ncbi:MAG: type II toxin-antitoxin system VapC family toxin [Planctomycetes bacterium]|nr:type II toxin-antitoxin system VapC family toxin [Planctomycetota bacterium]